ncbi:2-succinyl-5-enolpyruvyl-6-hydroxy-3-cyclohexene-1-carboxylic-acid synthase [Candidatus Saccharibacteria bacterium]|nr:2-succinyl-5-enolpyruvyl-6-hydroxy-3-cyclohexene-1-carboxylic-acid synthase [Candidatus Saccharibacteria bacterium]MBR3377768.1 2-succinyl-5-enolpyruvyl-6-hydroxy-3-cyclohexene-1-carboxylic-acid synthase [Candidatus Saccharibacteria bacterium]
MYTEVKSYQYVIALLKEYGITDCVLSAGSRNVPFVHSVEEDPFFNCYSVVDERSAGYFALGLAQEKNKPVVLSCTSSTATCNYWPPVAEAFYQDVPLVILTSDRDQRMVGQWEDQLIDQVGMYDRHVRKSVNLPIINDKNDEVYCQRLINEALLELNHNGKKGPVHINIPTNTYNRSFIVKKLPETRVINRIKLNDIKFEEKKKQIEKYKKILVVCGQQYCVTDELKEGIRKFFEIYNSVIVGDYTSNINIPEMINTTVCMDSNCVSEKVLNKLMPDLVISLGGQVFSSIKEQLKNNSGKFEHWAIEPDGRVVDMYKSLTTIFECTPLEFFENITSNQTNANNKKYYGEFKKYHDSIKLPSFDFSHAYAIGRLVTNIPEKSLLHLSINDSIRIANFFLIPESTEVYANIGTHGIDGCLSSFIGQSVANPKKESFLIIGDLAFFYDMNALRINSLCNNTHILLINNHGGSEFYYNKIQQNNDKHTTARHNNIAEGWVKDCGIDYLSAHDKKSFDKNLGAFINSEKPVVFEVFTEMSKDAGVIHSFYKESRPKDIKSEIKRRTKDLVKEKIGQEKIQRILMNVKKK